MEQLQHFSHDHMLNLVELHPDHMLNLVELHPDHNNENSDTEDENEEDFVEKDSHVGNCKMCEEEIYSFHLCYYSCKDCDYMLHKFCAQLPTTQQNHTLHPGHNLTLSKGFQFRDSDILHIETIDSRWMCGICNIRRKSFYNYNCVICNFTMDIICATVSEQTMDHPSHPHRLQRNFGRMISFCCACGNEHSGTFYHCTTCSWFRIHLDCALLPAKLLIQQPTDWSFNHPHLLTLTYSFPYIELKKKYFPGCKVCNRSFISCLWHYRCNKCRYYVHVECATSKKEPFMSIIGPSRLGKTYKNFKDDDHPNLIRCPFPDESFNLLKHHFYQKNKFITEAKIYEGKMFKHSSHQHLLILSNTLPSLVKKDPMINMDLLCDGCVRPIKDVPFFKCSQPQCDFILHEWCTRLPSQIQNHHDHRDHTLILLPKVPTEFFGVFKCEICRLPCNGFAYACMQCEYYVDINCGFLPDVITHEAHPNHLLHRVKGSIGRPHMYCKACIGVIESTGLGFHCPTCDFYVHTECAFFLPRTIRHKYDKHPLILRYNPVENPSDEYFCDICEEEFNPERWFYHCSMCDSSIHTACAPIKLQCEQSAFSNVTLVFWYLNVKFGGILEIEDHPHPLTFIQGIDVNDRCTVCHENMQHDMIFKCFSCKFSVHYSCVRGLPLNPTIHDATSFLRSNLVTTI